MVFRRSLYLFCGIPPGRVGVNDRISPDEVLSGNDMRNRLWERFGIIIGGSTYEIEKLQSSGMLLQIDEDSLERNFTSFAALLESMDFAEVMADGILQIRLGGSD